MSPVPPSDEKKPEDPGPAHTGEIVRSEPADPKQLSTPDLVARLARCAAVAAELGRRAGPLAGKALSLFAALWRRS